jgi:FAD/FMN-containing dehydrogenase
MDLISRVKSAFDPKGILNPGKMIRCPEREG